MEDGSLNHRAYKAVAATLVERWNTKPKPKPKPGCELLLDSRFMVEGVILVGWA